MSTSKKYFRTFHVPWTKSTDSDDRILSSVEHFSDREVVITEKLDGENQTWTRDSVYARSHGGPPGHASNNLSKQLWESHRHLIDPGLSVFFEWTYALHSIWYRRMAAEYSYVHIFGVRDDHTGEHWAWEDVEMMAEHLGYPTVPVLWRGTLQDAKMLQVLMTGQGPSAWTGVPVVMRDRNIILDPEHTADDNVREGEVVRVTSSFTDPDVSIAKVVRPRHVKSNDHWKAHWKPMHRWAL